MDAEERRQDLAEARAAERGRLAAMAEADGRVDRYCRGVELAFQASMVELGYHRQGRHGWRRRRMSTTEAVQTPAATGPKKLTRTEALVILKRAQDPECKTAQADAHTLMTSNWRAHFLDNAGSPARFLMETLADTIAGGEENAMIERAMEDKAAEMTKELTPPDAAPLEKMLARRVVVCWFALHVAEWQAQRRMKAGTAREIEANAKRVDSAHRRMMSTIRALSDFRKAAAPGVTLNVLNQQAIVARRVSGADDPPGL